MRLAFSILAVLGLAAVWWYAASLMPGLPDQIPAHFGASGAPDRWTDKSALWLLPQIDVGVTALMLALGWLTSALARRVPGLVNLPEKEAFVRLPEDARGRVVAPLGAAFAFFALAEQGLFAWLLRATSEVALGHAKALDAAPLPIFMIAGVVGLLAGTFATRRAIARETAG